MFLGAKRKRHPMMTAIVWGLAVFGAYSAVSCIKDKACGCISGIKCMCGKLGKHKKDACACQDEHSEPYDG